MVSRREILDQLFHGSFTFRRSVSSPQVVFEGKASFEIKEPSQRLYSESGTYYMVANKKISFYQKLIFNLTPMNLRIFKRDNELLHALSLEGTLKNNPLLLSDTHICKADHYSFFMKVDSSEIFSTAYIVRGPFKNYKIDTLYRRVLGQL